MLGDASLNADNINKLDDALQMSKAVQLDEAMSKKSSEVASHIGKQLSDSIPSGVEGIDQCVL